MIVCSFDVKTLSKYDILVLVSNRLYLVLVIGLYTRYGYRNLFTSKGDGNSKGLLPLRSILIV